MRDIRLIAAIVGLETVLIATAVLLLVVTDGTLFEHGSGLEYSALACMIIFVIVVTFVMPIWAVFHYRRSRQAGASSRGPKHLPSGGR